MRKKLIGPDPSFGVKRINISLDTLNEKKFTEITRLGRLDQVLKGIDAAQKSGLRVKLNMVALKGFNEDELEDVVRWCGEREIDLTFIEVMPMGEVGEKNRLGQFWSLKDLRERLAKTWTLEETNLSTGGPAHYVHLVETGQKIGFITPLSHNFCASCNRVRITCTGQIYQCLGQENMLDLCKILRENPEHDGPLDDAISKAIGLKPEGHGFRVRTH